MTDRSTFRDILVRLAPQNAEALERKAQLASRLAKAYAGKAMQFYKIKNGAVNQLFRIPKFMPPVRELELAPRGDLIVSIRYVNSGCLQHILARHLDEVACGRLPLWAGVSIRANAFPRRSLNAKFVRPITKETA